MCARRADGERVHDKELIKPPCPLRVQRFSSMKRTPRVVIPPPHRGAEKMQNGSVLSPPTAGLPPKPSKAISVGRGRATERASPAACGGTRDSSSARTTARDSSSARTTGQHRICLVCGEAAALPNAPSGQSPAPKFRAEARTHSLLRLEKKHEKRYQIQYAHGVRRPRED